MDPPRGFRTPPGCSAFHPKSSVWIFGSFVPLSWTREVRSGAGIEAWGGKKKKNFIKIISLEKTWGISFPIPGSVRGLNGALRRCPLQGPFQPKPSQDSMEARCHSLWEISASHFPQFGIPSLSCSRLPREGTSRTAPQNSSDSPSALNSHKEGACGLGVAH